MKIHGVYSRLLSMHFKELQTMLLAKRFENRGPKFEFQEK